MQQLVKLDKSKMLLENDGETYGLFILKDKEEIKSNIKFIHEKPNLHTRITLKFILLDESSLDLQATVKIEKGAPKTDSFLKIDTLLLSDKSNAHVVPSMEIMEDDVKGGHGATIGMLDEKQMWYLRSRGIEEKEARKMLILAFAQSLIDQIEDDDIKKELEERLEKLEV
jgi:Fe-S cluster assembly protein SufD